MDSVAAMFRFSQPLRTMSRSRLLSGIFLGLATFASANPAPRPNILWITTEDMSAQLGCYGDPEARTPHVDALARESVRYTHAFAPAPVCSPARSSLITGMYAAALGTQRLRSQFPVASEVRAFSTELRAAGYYCTNNVKTDYNLAGEKDFIRAAWDESSATAHWRSRPAGRPFFSVINLMTTHQSRSSGWPYAAFEREVAAQLSPEERTDPAKVTLPPYYPDTAESRRTWARYRDCITAMDKQVAQILAQLAEDGLAGNTIVFFFSDHGMGLPRGKRTLYDSGLHVPLLIRFPEKWQHLAPALPGEAQGELVNFVDFAPTVLRLAGIPAPTHYQGRAFLGPDLSPPRRYVHGTRDRVDDAFDVARSVRDRRWLYIRNHMPHLSWMQPEGYSDTSLLRQEMKRLAREGQAGGGFAGYAALRRPLEELYDTTADPHQLNNLASDPQYQAELQRLRAELRRWQLEIRDAGYVTEPQMRALLNPGEDARAVATDDRRYPLTKLLAAANAVGGDGQSAKQRLWLGDPNDALRYWAAVGLRARTQLDAADRSALHAALNDSSPTVRIEAASALAAHGEIAIALPVLRTELAAPANDIVLHAARALQHLGSAAAPVFPEMLKALAKARPEEAAGDDYAMFIGFALAAALEGQPGLDAAPALPANTNRP